MSSLADIMSGVAAFAGSPDGSATRYTVAQLSNFNGVNLLLTAINNGMRTAERMHDFYLSQADALLSIASTGTPYSAATALDSSPITIKRVASVNLPMADGYAPIEFLTNDTYLDRVQRLLGRSSYSATTTLSQQGYSQANPAAVMQGQTISLIPANQFTFPVAAQLSVVQFLPELTTAPSTAVLASGGSPYNGTYTNYGVQNGYPFYIAQSLDKTLWYNGTAWVVTAIADFLGSPVNYFSFTTTNRNPTGTYAAHGTASGTPTVTATDAVTTNFFLDVAPEYLQWSAIVELNRLLKQFGLRPLEGDVAEPMDLANAAFQSLIAWDDSLSGSTTSPESSSTVPYPTTAPQKPSA